MKTNKKLYGGAMKRVIATICALLVFGVCYAGILDYGVDFGNSRIDFNVTVTSYVATPIISSADIAQNTRIELINHGPNDVYISSYTAFDTSGSACRLIRSSETYVCSGENHGVVYANTAKGTSNTTRVDGTVLKE